jgi:hypothetical protein
VREEEIGPPWTGGAPQATISPDSFTLGVDFPPYLREIKALNIDGSVSIELEYSPEPGRIVEWVREAYESTDRLMRQVGLRG